MQLELFKKAVMDSRDGITVSEVTEAGNPLIFVNPAFERMTGYALEEITNIDCRYLQNEDRDQPGLPILRNALSRGEYCLVTLRNYRKDGSLFWNELSISPIFDGSGKVTNFIGIQKDVTARVSVEEHLLSSYQKLEEDAEELAVLAMVDGLTGIYNRRFFDAQLDIQWKIADRAAGAAAAAPLTLVIVDIDLFKSFNDIYGHPTGDMALRAVAQSLNISFTRSSDFVARYGGEEFAILSSGLTVEQARMFALALCGRVRSLRIPHAGSPSGFLTISAGYAVHAFRQTEPPGSLVKMADEALYLAKKQGRDRCVGYEPSLPLAS